ncbi:BMC domain-containing protein [Paenibacillus sp. BSR1-1]|uniref:BMC domain-containing protein n=1 Tax=Paenibacillus sp. BSR1-1 TaxID=3020845 RepID=UPI0025B0892D|nr:BMC domain-containing protein [Paenibacillus sp. BSR1-1]MDN3016931.1 BMC domain-containing protein [Paenibacillus sp. BSR1-1]
MNGLQNQAYALGMIETIGFPALIAAADAASKAADVKVVTYQGADSGIVTIYIIGDVASVKASVEVGSDAAKKVGQLRHSHVIARPDDHIIQMVFPGLLKKEQSEKKENKNDKPKDWTKSSLQELRELANSYKSFPLSFEEISSAKREELLKQISKFLAEKGGDK